MVNKQDTKIKEVFKEVPITSNDWDLIKFYKEDDFTGSLFLSDVNDYTHIKLFKRVKIRYLAEGVYI